MRDHILPVAEYLVSGPKSLESLDSSIERSFAGDDVEEGSSKDRRDDAPMPADALLQLELFPGMPSASEHHIVIDDQGGKAFQAKDRKDCERSFGSADPDDEPVVAAGHSLGFDSRIETGLPRVTTPARPLPKRPQRIADRPRSEEWNDDELLTLPEAAALFWPDGPITTNTLRTAGRDGALAITKVAGKFFTTPMAIRRMGGDGVGEKSKQPEADEMSAFPTLQMKIAEAQRLGGGRARSRRAAKGPVTTAANGGSGR
ncbi:hypothetical protein [Methylobacterium sp. J-068]|uniref:hypothetical protein n=1 Tax=Methylobacterium sp. J-068 TaxID=2836649 RepID=UPI001FBBC71F|nr:hypothetical protein [Methylobacterium sp. J-068]MCJ2036142.1 hypothetical protein [Methylobacterium sp. J-068]